MKKALSTGLALIAACFSLLAQTNAPSASPSSLLNTGIAVSIVYDGSGSMLDPVPGVDDQPTPKYLIANHAVDSVLKQLLAYSQAKHVEVQAGLIYFVNGKIHQAIPLKTLTPAQAARFSEWTQGLEKPAGGTPLGRAIEKAQNQLSNSACYHKHILVITDGMSNSGIAPEKVVRKLNKRDHPIPVYFVAFDVAANVFDGVRAEGATVVSASNESQLNTQINAILGQKILLEAE